MAFPFAQVGVYETIGEGYFQAPGGEALELELAELGGDELAILLGFLPGEQVQMAIEAPADVRR